MIASIVERPRLRADVRADLPRHVLAAVEHNRAGHAAPLRRRKDQMGAERGNQVPTMAVLLRDCQ